MKVILCDTNADLCRAWHQAFRGATNVQVFHGSVRSGIAADAIVSPANSFGFMDGGIDALYLELFGYDLQRRLQDEISRMPFGELLVGEAVALPLGDGFNYKWMISAPTMRTPMVIKDEMAVRLSTRAALMAARKRSLSSVVIPGMGAGSGMVHPIVCAHMMLSGWQDVFEPRPFPKSWQEAAQ